jgi:hypothetical protein
MGERFVIAHSIEYGVLSPRGFPMIAKISVFNESVTLRLDTTSGSLFSSDVDGVLASSIVDMLKTEQRYFGIYGTVQSTGTDILSDPWSFFLWLKRLQFDPIWVSVPPKVPTVPKGSFV